MAEFLARREEIGRFYSRGYCTPESRLMWLGFVSNCDLIHLQTISLNQKLCHYLMLTNRLRANRWHFVLWHFLAMISHTRLANASQDCLSPQNTLCLYCNYCRDIHSVKHRQNKAYEGGLLFFLGEHAKGCLIMRRRLTTRQLYIYILLVFTFIVIVIGTALAIQGGLVGKIV